jgi:hypothetical protein
MSARWAMLVATVAFASAHAADGKPEFGGVWLVENPQAQVKTIDGKEPPLRPKAAELFAKRKAAGKADDPVEDCVPQGVPRILSVAQPIQILQKPKQVTVLYQANHQARMFYIDDPLPKPEEAPDVTYNGTSYARWSGDRLLVDTISMNDQTWLDDAGLPHSDQMTLMEQYELADPDHLRVTVTVTDPATFTNPWKMRVTYKRQPGLRLQENACAEKLWHPPSGKAG